MSGIIGFNFVDQVVASADLAAMFRSIMTDGRLHGCTLTYDRSQLTVSTGRMIIGGFLFKITSDQVLTAPSGYSGEANLVAQIDLTQTSTSESFNQVSLSLKRSDEALQKDDLDTTGTVYEAAIGKVSVTNGVINSIVSQIPSARRSIYELTSEPDPSIGKDGDICILIG